MGHAPTWTLAEVKFQSGLNHLLSYQSTTVTLTDSDGRDRLGFWDKSKAATAADSHCTEQGDDDLAGLQTVLEGRCVCHQSAGSFE